MPASCGPTNESEASDGADVHGADGHVSAHGDTGAGDRGQGAPRSEREAGDRIRRSGGVEATDGQGVGDRGERPGERQARDRAMTTKKTARKPKTFWAVLVDEPWGEGETAVRVFPSRPANRLAGFYCWRIGSNNG